MCKWCNYVMVDAVKGHALSHVLYCDIGHLSIGIESEHCVDINGGESKSNLCANLLTTLNLISVEQV